MNATNPPEIKMPPPVERRKRDWVTLVAVILFSSVIVFEIVLVAVLPFKLRSQAMVRQEVAAEELIRKLDFIRARMIDFKRREQTYSARGFTEVMEGALDEIARYVRVHEKQLSIGQMKELSELVDEFYQFKNPIREATIKLTPVTISPESFVEVLLLKCDPNRVNPQ